MLYELSQYCTNPPPRRALALKRLRGEPMHSRMHVVSLIALAVERLDCILPMWCSNIPWKHADRSPIEPDSKHLVSQICRHTCSISKHDWALSYFTSLCGPPFRTITPTGNTHWPYILKQRSNLKRHPVRGLYKYTTNSNPLLESIHCIQPPIHCSMRMKTY